MKNKAGKGTLVRKHVIPISCFVTNMEIVWTSTHRKIVFSFLSKTFGLSIFLSLSCSVFCIICSLFLSLLLTKMSPKPLIHSSKKHLPFYMALLCHPCPILLIYLSHREFSRSSYRLTLPSLKPVPLTWYSKQFPP